MTKSKISHLSVGGSKQKQQSQRQSFQESEQKATTRAFSPETLGQAPGLLRDIREFDPRKLFASEFSRGIQGIRSARAGGGLLSSGAGQREEGRFLEGLGLRFGAQQQDVKSRILASILGQGTTAESFATSSGLASGTSAGSGRSFSLGLGG